MTQPNIEWIHGKLASRLEALPPRLRAPVNFITTLTQVCANNSNEKRLLNISLEVWFALVLESEENPEIRSRLEPLDPFEVEKLANDLKNAPQNKDWTTLTQKTFHAIRRGGERRGK